jgi:hypothetical protein
MCDAHRQVGAGIERCALWCTPYVASGLQWVGGPFGRGKPEKPCYRRVADSAFFELQREGGWSTLNDNSPFNAVLHCYGVCRLQKECGSFERFVVAYGHEIWDKRPDELFGMPPLLRSYPGTLNDLSNNSAGVDCATKNQCNSGGKDCLSCCMEKLQSGGLRFQPRMPYETN